MDRWWNGSWRVRAGLSGEVASEGQEDVASLGDQKNMAGAALLGFSKVCRKKKSFIVILTKTCYVLILQWMP